MVRRQHHFFLCFSILTPLFSSARRFCQTETRLQKPTRTPAERRCWRWRVAAPPPPTGRPPPPGPPPWLSPLTRHCLRCAPQSPAGRSSCRWHDGSQVATAAVRERRIRRILHNREAVSRQFGYSENCVCPCHFNLIRTESWFIWLIFSHNGSNFFHLFNRNSYWHKPPYWLILWTLLNMWDKLK